MINEKQEWIVNAKFTVKKGFFSKKETIGCIIKTHENPETKAGQCALVRSFKSIHPEYRDCQVRYAHHVPLNYPELKTEIIYLNSNPDIPFSHEPTLVYGTRAQDAYTLKTFVLHFEIAECDNFEIADGESVVIGTLPTGVELRLNDERLIPVSNSANYYEGLQVKYFGKVELSGKYIYLLYDRKAKGHPVLEKRPKGVYSVSGWSTIKENTFETEVAL